VLTDKLSFAAIDALFEVKRAGYSESGKSQTMHAKIVARYGPELRRVLEIGLVNRHQLSSLFPFPRDRAEYIITALGLVGDE
jgi:hypothetical protein